MSQERGEDLQSGLTSVTPEAAWRADVVYAHAAALAWVRDTTGRYPAPRRVAEHLLQAAEKLKNDSPTVDPDSVLIQVAARSLTEERHRAA